MALPKDELGLLLRARILRSYLQVCRKITGRWQLIMPPTFKTELGESQLVSKRRINCLPAENQTLATLWDLEPNVGYILRPKLHRSLYQEPKQGLLLGLVVFPWGTESY